MIFLTKQFRTSVEIRLNLFQVKSDGYEQRA